GGGAVSSRIDPHQAGEGSAAQFPATREDGARGMKELLKKIIAAEPLAPEEIRDGFEAILREETRDSEIALFLSALSTRGLDADVLTEAARVLRGHMTTVSLKTAGAIDTCGTGGGRRRAFHFFFAAPHPPPPLPRPGAPPRQPGPHPPTPP